MIYGTIKSFSNDNGYGFIQDGIGHEYFVHISDIVNQERLYKNDYVTFEIEKMLKGFQAVNVKLIQG